MLVARRQGRVSLTALGWAFISAIAVGVSLIMAPPALASDPDEEDQTPGNSSCSITAVVPYSQGGSIWWGVNYSPAECVVGSSELRWSLPVGSTPLAVITQPMSGVHTDYACSWGGVANRVLFNRVTIPEEINSGTQVFRSGTSNCLP